MGCEGEEAAGWHRNFASGGEKGGGVKSLVEENPGGGGVGETTYCVCLELADARWFGFVLS